MVDPKYDREQLDRRLRRVLRDMVANGRSYIKSKYIREEIDLPHQAIRPSIEHLRDQGDLERWQDSQPSSGSAVYRITLENDCGHCGRVHDSMAAAINCCDEQFEDPIFPAVRSQSGPAPGIVEAHGHGDSA